MLANTDNNNNGDDDDDREEGQETYGWTYPWQIQEPQDHPMSQL